MQFVPVVSANNEPLMPCHPARARELVRNGKAIRRFNKGIFYIKLTERKAGDTQPIAIGIDTGSKREGFTVKSAAHTFLNIQATSVDWVKYAVETRRQMRRVRRSRNTPCRQPRWSNRARQALQPSTKARWQWKLRLASWLSKMFPISQFVVEDIKAMTKQGQRRWNVSFSPLEQGKAYFYSELSKIAPVETKRGWETKELRDALGLKKSNSKLSEKFAAHCVDSWVLANWWTGGHTKVDNKKLLCVTPLRFHRRKLHVLQFARGGVRKPYGGTRSLGFKRGSLVTHPKYGLCYVGGTMQGRIGLHSLSDGKRLTQKARPTDVKFLAFNSWRTHFTVAQG